jgi:hypothetical protein
MELVNISINPRSILMKIGRNFNKRKQNVVTNKICGDSTFFWPKPQSSRKIFIVDVLKIPLFIWLGIYDPTL